MVYEDADEVEAAEDAYRESLAIKVRLGNIGGQANTLVQLGNLYLTKLGRTEEAVPFYRQAIDKYADIRNVTHEANARCGLAMALRQLGYLDEARKEVRLSIKTAESSDHAIEPWRFWNTLCDIETDAKNPTAAAYAKRQAINFYLAYRRDGGENYDFDGRVSLPVTEALLAGDPATAAAFLQEVAADLPDNAHTYIRALQAVVAGSRDPSLADSPDLDFGMATEILFLIETLESTAADRYTLPDEPAGGMV